VGDKAGGSLGESPIRLCGGSGAQSQGCVCVCVTRWGPLVFRLCLPLPEVWGVCVVVDRAGRSLGRSPLRLYGGGDPLFVFVEGWVERSKGCV
jgi:hypothetical protein